MALKITGERTKKNFISHLPAVDPENKNEFRVVETSEEGRAAGKKDVTIVYTKYALADGTVNDDKSKVNQEDWILSYDNAKTSVPGSGSAKMVQKQGPDGKMIDDPNSGYAVAITQVNGNGGVMYEQDVDLTAVAAIESEGRKNAAKTRTPEMSEEDLNKRYPANRITLTRNLNTTSKGVAGVTAANMLHQAADVAKHAFIYGPANSTAGRDAKDGAALDKVAVGQNGKTVGDLRPTQDDVKAAAGAYFKTFSDLMKDAMNGPVKVMSADGKNVIADIPKLSDLGFKAGGLKDGTIAIVAPGDAKSNPAVGAAIIELNKGFNARFSQAINGTYSAENAEKDGKDPNAYARIRSIGNAMSLNAYAVQPKDDKGNTANFTVINPTNTISITPYVNVAERGFAAAKTQEITIGGVTYNGKGDNNQLKPDAVKLTTEALFGKAVTEAAAKIDGYGPAEHLLQGKDAELTGADRANRISDIKAARLSQLENIANGNAKFDVSYEKAVAQVAAEIEGPSMA